MEEEDQGQLELRVGLGLVNGTAGLVGSLGAVAAWPGITTAPAAVTAWEAVIAGSLFGTVGTSGWDAKKSGWMV